MPAGMPARRICFDWTASPSQTGRLARPMLVLQKSRARNPSESHFLALIRHGSECQNYEFSRRRMKVMQSRMKQPVFIVPGAMEHLQALGKAVEQSGVPKKTLDLVHLRASQINGCSVCVDMNFRFKA